MNYDIGAAKVWVCYVMTGSPDYLPYSNWYPRWVLWKGGVLVVYRCKEPHRFVSAQ